MSNKQKTSNCNMHEALVSSLYDEATAEETSRVQSHLAECTACQLELHSFERVRGMLQQWQLDDLPVVRVVAERTSSERSMLAVLKELFSLTPVWAKALGAVAMAVLVLAVIGTDISVGRSGFSIHADPFRRDRSAPPNNITETHTPRPSKGSNIRQMRTQG